MTAPERLAGPLDLRAMRQQVTVMRAQAEALRRAADGLRDEEYTAPADYIEAVASSSEHAAELLTVFIQTAEAEASHRLDHCVCCTYDCGNRQGHVEMVGIENTEFGPERYHRCNCGKDWPCKETS